MVFGTRLQHKFVHIIIEDAILADSIKLHLSSVTPTVVQGNLIFRCLEFRGVRHLGLLVK